MIYFRIFKRLGSADLGYNSQMFPTVEVGFSLLPFLLVFPLWLFGTRTCVPPFVPHKGSMNPDSPRVCGLWA